jgi:hypothetical protein
MQVLLIPKVVVPHTLQVFTFVLKELKPTSAIKNMEYKKEKKKDKKQNTKKQKKDNEKT